MPDVTPVVTPVAVADNTALIAAIDAIKAFAPKLPELAPALADKNEDPKPGFKTSEGILCTIVILANVASLFVADTSPTGHIIAAIVAGLTALGYSAHRTAIKTAA